MKVFNSRDIQIKIFFIQQIHTFESENRQIIYFINFDTIAIYPSQLSLLSNLSQDIIVLGWEQSLLKSGV